MKQVVDQKKELFRWGPLDSFFLSIAFPSTSVIETFHSLYGHTWPQGMMLHHNEQVLWINDYHDLRAAGLKCFTELYLPPESRKNIRQAYEAEVQKLYWNAREVYDGSLASLDDDAFSTWLQEWSETYRRFWGHATAPEFSTWGVERKIQDLVTDLGHTGAALAEIMEALTAPTEISFFQEASLRLIELWHAKKEEGFVEYAEEYYWIENSYARTNRITSNDAQRELDQLKNEYGSIEAAQKELSLYKDTLHAKREKALKKYDLSETIREYSVRLGEAISWQDERKAEVFKQMDVLVALMEECQRRFRVPVEHTKLMTVVEFQQHHTDPTAAEKIFAERSNGPIALLSSAEGHRVATGEESQGIYDTFWHQVSKKQDMIGTIASFGQLGNTLSGVARIITSPTQAQDFQEGEILVSPMTTPDYLPVMRNAKAIVTDEGGLTAHAAVVSRELGIPCIVGVGSATQRITNGDTVTLNMQTGRITIENK